VSGEGVARNRLRLLPPIRRARLWRLYAEDGSRFLDFWMDGGRSILGAKGTGLGTVAKAAIDTGLTRPFPSVLEARLERSLARLYPEWAAHRIFRTEERALAAAATLLPRGSLPRILRPFLEHYEDEGRAPAGGETLALPLLPCPALLSPGVLLFRDAEAAAATEGDLVPPLSLAVAHRSLSEFERFVRSYTEELWKKVDRRLEPFFERRGPYLYSRVGEEDYEARFVAALKAGVLLSPRADLPSIVPGDFDDGELARLAKALAAPAQGSNPRN
jgi:hypothetical protein